MPNIKPILKSKSKNFDLEERTSVFGEKVVEFAQSLPKNQVNNPLTEQFVRAGTSIGANYCEADGAESRKDFVHKISICKKEAKETKYWLRMISKANPTRVSEARILWKEAQELTLIFSSIIIKAKQNGLKN